jgi:TIMELESS-interacting protein
LCTFFAYVFAYFTDDEIKKKRVLAPRPKLDPVRLMGPRGILALQAELKDVKLKGRGGELQDLELIMGRLQHWAHRLFPSYTFDDCLEKLEKLGAKKNVMVSMKFNACLKSQ